MSDVYDKEQVRTEAKLMEATLEIARVTSNLLDLVREGLQQVREVLVCSAGEYTCDEAVTMSTVLSVLGCEDIAVEFMAQHADEDGPEDRHYLKEPDPPTEWRVTFGVQYDGTAMVHPSVSWAHRDGYLVIEADGEMAARLAAIDVLGHAWSNIYPAGSVNGLEAYFPRGELARLSQSGDGQWVLTVNETGGRL